MRKFITEFPIFSMLVTSCLSVTLFVMVSTTLLFGIFFYGLKSAFTAIEKESKQVAHGYRFVEGNSDSTNKILIIPIDGVILTTTDYSDPLAPFLSYYTYGYDVKEKLIKAGDDPEVKAIILYISSPGGTVTGSAAIHDGVRYVREVSNKPVVAHITDLGASGAYMAAAGANEIIADQGSLIGSIGVLMGPFKYYDGVISESDFMGSVTTTDGIESYYISAGIDKDAGYPYKRMSELATTSLQENVDREYSMFVGLVSRERNIPAEVIQNDIGALVYDSVKSESLGLIDSVGSRTLATKSAYELAGIQEGDYQLVQLRRTDFWGSLFESSNRYLPSYISKAQNQTCYLCGKMLFIYPAYMTNREL